jgi:hypothetical protein
VSFKRSCGAEIKNLPVLATIGVNQEGIGPAVIEPLSKQGYEVSAIPGRVHV